MAGEEDADGTKGTTGTTGTDAADASGDGPVAVAAAAGHEWDSAFVPAEAAEESSERPVSVHAAGCSMTAAAAVTTVARMAVTATRPPGRRPRDTGTAQG